MSAIDTASGFSRYDGDDIPILTATPSDPFVLAHADDDKAFSVVIGPERRKK